MAWRRKSDGRPYADLFVGGQRRRISLLHPGERAISDEEAAARYRVLAAGLRTEQDTCRQPRRLELLSDLTRWYCDIVMTSRGNKRSTIEQNRVILARAVRYLNEHEVSTWANLAAFPAILDEYTVWRSRHVQASTVNKEMAAIRAVFRAAYERGMVDAMPLRQWPRLKLPEPEQPEPLTPEEIHRVLDDVREHSPSLHAVIRFIVYTGCRPVDAVHLRWQDVHGLDTAEPVAQFRQAKTGRYVAVALSPPAVEAIVTGMQTTSGDLVFRASASGIRTALIAVRRRTGIEVSAKRFRQSLVSVLYDQGADDALVRRITGHQSRAIRAYRQLRRGAAHELATAYARALDGVTVSTCHPTCHPSA